LWKAITILFLVGASTVFAIDNAEQLSIESVIPLQINSCPEFCPPQQQSECINMGLSAAARELLAPPIGFAQSPDRLPVGVTALPTVPATFFMVLCGFLCVVFVKDRKVWLVALAGLFWAGQAGINAIPKLVLRLAEGSNGPSRPAQSSLSLYLGNSSGLPSYNEGTRYIGLLRHLAGISDSRFKFQISDFKYNKTQKSVDAIITSQISSSLFRCLVKRTEHIVYFTPAFIFDNLARGPPAKS
jgi:hypothetical protein